MSISFINQLAYIGMVLLHSGQEFTYPIVWPSITIIIIKNNN